MRRRRLAYYDYVASGPGPNVVVIEDCDWPRPVGAFWGEVNAAIHKGLGIAGTVTSGLMRDLDAIDEGYQILAGGIGPSHAFVHILETDCPVTVFGMSVHPNDLIHADRHGAVVVPEANIGAIAEAIGEVEHNEAPILEAARRPGFDIETLRKIWGGSDDVD